MVRAGFLDAMIADQQMEAGLARHDVFVTGATGYIGRALVPALLARGHTVRALVRRGSERKAPAGVQCVHGDALDAATYRDRVAPADTFIHAATYRDRVAPADTFIHLVGTPHPAPWKGRQFRAVDLVSIQAAVESARYAAIRHFIYLSVAQPAPVMAAYIAVRQAGEDLLARSGLPHTVVRPWYVLGPGHYWPLLVAPVYSLLEKLPPTRDMALRLALIRLEQMVAALADAVTHPAAPRRLIDVADMRALRGSLDAV
jgi:uncharacterized protein YbjT (DUF2867 family)